MIFVIFLVVVFIASTSHASFPLDPEEIAAVQERLSKYEMLEEIVKSIFLPEEMREEKKECIPEGGTCKFASGPNCCGIETRCVMLDTQLTAKKKSDPVIWLSKCRRYNLGILLKKIEEAFGK